MIVKNGSVFAVLSIMLVVSFCGCINDDEDGPLANLPPLAKISGPSIGWTDDPLIFNATNSTDDEVGVLVYAWEWGDGEVSNGTGAVATHVFKTSGVFRVNVTVSDIEGASDTASINITISWRITINLQSPDVKAQSGTPVRYEVVLNINKVTPSTTNIPWTELRIKVVGAIGTTLQPPIALSPDTGIYATPGIPEFWYVDTSSDGSIDAGDAIKFTGIDTTWEGSDVYLQINGESVGAASLPTDFV